MNILRNIKAISLYVKQCICKAENINLAEIGLVVLEIWKAEFGNFMVLEIIHLCAVHLFCFLGRCVLMK